MSLPVPRFPVTFKTAALVGGFPAPPGPAVMVTPGAGVMAPFAGGVVDVLIPRAPVRKVERFARVEAAPTVKDSVMVRVVALAALEGAVPSVAVNWMTSPTW